MYINWKKPALNQQIDHYNLSLSFEFSEPFFAFAVVLSFQLYIFTLCDTYTIKVVYSESIQIQLTITQVTVETCMCIKTEKRFAFFYKIVWPVWKILGVLLVLQTTVQSYETTTSKDRDQTKLFVFPYLCIFFVTGTQF